MKQALLLATLTTCVSAEGKGMHFGVKIFLCVLGMIVACAIAVWIAKKFCKGDPGPGGYSQPTDMRVDFDGADMEMS